MQGQVFMKKEALSDPVEVLGQKSLSVILDETEQRANAATKGPWSKDWGRVRDGECDDICNVPRGHDWQIEPWISNAEFIAAARSDVPALVKALRHAHLIFRHANDEESISALAQLLSEPAGSVPSGNAPLPSLKDGRAK